MVHMEDEQVFEGKRRGKRSGRKTSCEVVSSKDENSSGEEDVGGRTVLFPVGVKGVKTACQQ